MSKSKSKNPQGKGTICTRCQKFEKGLCGATFPIRSKKERKALRKQHEERGFVDVSSGCLANGLPVALTGLQGEERIKRRPMLAKETCYDFVAKERQA